MGIERDYPLAARAMSHVNLSQMSHLTAHESIEPDPNDSGTMGKQRQEGGADEFTIAYAGAVQAAR